MGNSTYCYVIFITKLNFNFNIVNRKFDRIYLRQTIEFLISLRYQDLFSKIFSKIKIRFLSMIISIDEGIREQHSLSLLSHIVDDLVV